MLEIQQVVPEMLVGILLADQAALLQRWDQAVGDLDHALAVAWCMDWYKQLQWFRERQKGLSQVWGSGGDRHWRAWIVGWLESLSEAGTERAIIDGATDLEQQIGAASRPAHLL